MSCHFFSIPTPNQIIRLGVRWIPSHKFFFSIFRKNWVYTWLVDLSVATIDDLQCPPALRPLAPEVNAEEGPVFKVGAGDVPRSLEQQHRGGAHWRRQNDAQVAPGEEAQWQLALHMLEIANLVERPSATVHIHLRLQNLTRVGENWPGKLLVKYVLISLLKKVKWYANFEVSEKCLLSKYFVL